MSVYLRITYTRSYDLCSLSVIALLKSGLHRNDLQFRINSLDRTWVGVECAASSCRAGTAGSLIVDSQSIPFKPENLQSDTVCEKVGTSLLIKQLIDLNESRIIALLGFKCSVDFSVLGDSLKRFGFPDRRRKLSEQIWPDRFTILCHRNKAVNIADVADRFESNEHASEHHLRC